jgi:hypothetical protein
MAALQSDTITNRTPIPGVGMGGGQVRMIEGTVAVPTTIAEGDTMEFFFLPPNAKVVDAYIISDDLDSGTPAFVWDLGVAGAVDTFFADTTAGQTAAVTKMTKVTGFEYTTAYKALVFGTLVTDAATAVAGDLTVRMFYLVEEPQ